MAQFSIKRNDRLPKIRMTLTDSNGAALNLTGAAVLFRMKARGGTSTKISAAGTIVDAAGGIVEYPWAAGDTDTAGIYDAEWRLTYADGVQTVPTSGYVAIVVEQTLA